MRVPPMIAVALLLAAPLAAAPSAMALVPADVELTAGPVSSVVSVSPDVFYDSASSTYYLYTTGLGTGGPPAPGAPSIGVFTSVDGGSWSPAPGASTPVGPYFDPSVIAMADGSYRMYYVYRSGTSSRPCSGKQLKYATSRDLIRWEAQAPVLLEDLGCGVPNVVRAGDADFRLYYVRGGERIEHGTYMATSPNGLDWSAREGMLTPEDFVDPSVVKLNDGSWLMFTADFPATQPPPPGFVQKLYVGTSADGVKWDFDAGTPVYTALAGQGAFDPDAVVLPDGSVRAWWAQGTSPDTARVAAGTVTVSIEPEPVVPVPPAKPKAAWTSKALKVSWVYASGAPAPESFQVQVRTTGSWSTVATVTGDRAAASVSRAKLPKSAFSVRVLAVVGDASAASPVTKVAKPR